ncbi:MAG: c-type cytochrome [Rhizobiaceae bacterium]|nr:MAG: c-type cytochrome [Rhizobiaceae bacterium]CAG0995115.1 Fructose dehydrogenase cytochrome subunit [Rhizobiaceae bacterium]
MGLVGRVSAAAILLAVAGGAAFWLLTTPHPLDGGEIAALGTGDSARGEKVFNAGGCSSCHARPKSEGAARLQLVGGVELNTPFGTFVAPNISQDPRDGIGLWSLEDFANAMLRGVSPGSEHYYPAFPYSSYARMAPGDVADLYSYMKTLPAIAGAAPDHRLGFPFNIRRGLGLWKLLHLGGEPVITLADDASEAVRRGRYLVEGPGHCGECHTPRDLSGGVKKGEWLAGAVAAEGTGNIPNITSGDGGIGAWSAEEIAFFLESGFTPDFDSAGGAMAEVIKNTALLAPEDRAAIAAYLKAVPPRPNGYPAAAKPAS